MLTRAKPISTRRKRNCGGNVMLESVFTFIPTLALILFFADLGMMLFRWSTLQNAVREGCRYAVTFQTQGASGQDASIESVVQKYSLGLVSASDSPNLIHVDYYSPASPNTAIGTGGNIPGNVVEVSVQGVTLAWMMPLSGTLASPLYATLPLTLTVRASDVLGGLPAGVSSVSR